MIRIIRKGRFSRISRQIFKPVGVGVVCGGGGGEGGREVGGGGSVISVGDIGGSGVNSEVCVWVLWVWVDVDVCAGDWVWVWVWVWDL